MIKSFLPRYFKLRPIAKEQFHRAWKVTLETRARSREDCDGHRSKMEEPLKEIKQGSAFMRTKTLISELPFVLRATDMPETKRDWYCLIVLLNALQTIYTGTSFDATTWNMAPLLESYGMKLRNLLHTCDSNLSATTMKIHRIVHHLPSVVAHFGPLRLFWAQESEGSFGRHKDIYAAMSGQKSIFPERLIKAETLHEASLNNTPYSSSSRGWRSHIISTLHIGDFVMSRDWKRQRFWEIVAITNDEDGETFFHGIPWKVHRIDSEMYHYPVLRKNQQPSENEKLNASLSDLDSRFKAVPIFPDFSSSTLQVFARTHPPIHTVFLNA